MGHALFFGSSVVNFGDWTLVLGVWPANAFRTVAAQVSTPKGIIIDQETCSLSYEVSMLFCAGMHLLTVMSQSSLKLKTLLMESPSRYCSLLAHSG
jgi:hypothetical protein